MKKAVPVAKICSHLSPYWDDELSALHNLLTNFPLCNNILCNNIQNCCLTAEWIDPFQWWDVFGQRPDFILHHGMPKGFSARTVVQHHSPKQEVLCAIGPLTMFRVKQNRLRRPSTHLLGTPLVTRCTKGHTPSYNGKAHQGESPGAVQRL